LSGKVNPMKLRKPTTIGRRHRHHKNLRSQSKNTNHLSIIKKQQYARYCLPLLLLSILVVISYSVTFVGKVQAGEAVCVGDPYLRRTVLSGIIPAGTPAQIMSSDRPPTQDEDSYTITRASSIYFYTNPPLSAGNIAAGTWNLYIWARTRDSLSMLDASIDLVAQDGSDIRPIAGIVGTSISTTTPTLRTVSLSGSERNVNTNDRIRLTLTSRSGSSYDQSMSFYYDGYGTYETVGSETRLEFPQVTMTVSYSIAGTPPGTPTAPPTFNYVQNYVSKTYTLTATPTVISVDVGSSWSVTPNPLSGSTSSERWYSNQALSGTASATTIVFGFYHQYLQTLSYAVSGGGSGYSAPIFTANSFGSSLGQTLTTTPTGYWFDAGSSWSVTNPLTGSTSSEQWWTSQTTSGTISSAQTLAFSYQHQYQVTFTSSGIGSDSSGTIVTVNSNAKTQSQLPYTAWFDAGSLSYSFSSPVSTSDSNKRYAWTSTSGMSQTLQSNTFTLGSTGTITGTYNTQWQVTVTSSGISTDSTGTVATLDGAAKTQAQLPYSAWFNNAYSLTYAFSSPVSTSDSNKRYTWSSTSGLSQTLQTNTFSVTAGGTITGTYGIQYQVAIASSGIGADTSGTVATLDGDAKTQSQLPYSKWLASEYSLTYSFSSPVSAGSTKQYVWASTSGLSQMLQTNTFPVSSGGTITGTYSTQYYLTVNSAYGSPSGAGWYDSGATASFSVTSPVSGPTGTQYVCTGYSGDASGSGTSGSTIMDSVKTITFSWQTQYQHTVTSSPVEASGFVKVDDIAQTTPYTTPWWDSGSSHTIEALSPLSGGTGTQYVFQSWSDTGAQLHTIAPTSVTTFTANYKTQYCLTVDSAYGSPTGAGWYDSGSSASFSVTSPVSGGAGTQYVCTGYSGDASGSGTSGSITMDGPKTVTFNWKTQYQVTFTSNDIGDDSSGTVVIVNGNAKTKSNLPYTDWYDSGSTIDYEFSSTVSATATKRYAWVSTSGLGQSGRTGSFSVTGTGTVTGTYGTEYQLTISVSPSGGGSTDPAPGSYWHDMGSSVTVTETPGNGFQFDHWDLDGSNKGSVPSYAVEMNAPHTLTAIFQSNRHVIIVHPSSVTAGSWTSKYTVQRQDQSGTPVTSGSTTIHLASTSTGTNKKFAETAGGGPVTSVVIPDGSNTKDFYYYDELAGTWTITVFDGSIGDGKPLTVNPASLDHFTFNTVGSPQAAGSIFSITITAKDAYENTVTGYSGTNTLSDSTGTISPTVTGAFTSGSWTGNVTVTKAELWVTITTAGSGKSGESDPFYVKPAGGLRKIVFTTPPQTLTAGVASAVVAVQIQDNLGNPVKVASDTKITLTSTSTAGKFSLSPSPWRDINTVTIVAKTSSASFYYSDASAGRPTITAAEDPDGDLIDATQQETINPAALDHFAFDPIGGPQTVNTSFTTAIIARDQYGNTVTAYAGTNTLSDSTGTVKPASTGTFTSGVWTGSVTVAKAQAGVTITTIGSEKSGASNPFWVAPSPDFAIYISPITPSFPTVLQVVRNNSGTVMVQIVSIANFQDDVALTLQNIPAGVAYSFKDATVAPLAGGYVFTNLVIKTIPSANIGDYTLTVSGSGGGKNHTTSFVLRIVGAQSYGKCIIATATYGSEFSPQVQFLRDFRDRYVLSTVAGREFMKVFNLWYYSFSPQIASWIVSNPSVEEPIKLLLLPLLGILRLSEISYTPLAFAPEAAVTVAGIVASLLIGIVYFSPVLAVVYLKGVRKACQRLLTWTTLIWGISLFLLSVGIASTLQLVMFASSILVLSTMTFGACSIPLMVSGILDSGWKMKIPVCYDLINDPLTTDLEGNPLVLVFPA